MSRCTALSLLIATCLLNAGCSDSDPSGGTPDSSTDAAQTMDSSTEEDAATGEDAAVDAVVEVDSTVPEDAATDGPVTPVLVTPTLPGQLVITEIMTKPVGYVSDKAAEWIEIHNPSATVTYNLEGCRLSDTLLPEEDDPTIVGEVAVPPGAYIVLSTTVATLTTHGFVNAYAYGENPGFGGTDVPTITCGLFVIDTFSYSTAAGFPAVVPGHSYQLSSNAVSATSNDTASNWCTGVPQFMTDNPATGTPESPLVEEGYGTPGAANTACPQP